MLLLLPSVPRSRAARQRRQALDPGRAAPVPARRAREDLPDHLPRRLPARQARGARAGRLKDLGPLLAIWGAAMLVLVQTSDLGSALLNFGIFLAMVYVATGRVSTSASGSRCSSAASAALYNALDRVQQRVTVWLAPVDRRQGLLRDQRQARLPAELRLVPARQEPLLDRERRLRRHGARQGDVHDRRRDAADPASSTPTSSTRRSRRSSG